MTVEKSGKKWYNTAGQWLEQYGPEVIQALGAGLLALSQILLALSQSPESQIPAVFIWGAFILGLIGVIAGLIGSVKRTASIAKVTDERDEKAARAEHLDNVVKDLTTFYLRKLAEDLRLGETERITVYHHMAGRFYPFGRFSSNATFDKPGRPDYPENQGCIGIAWRKGEAFINDLPDPDTDTDAYLAACQKRFQLEPQVVSQLTMKSRSYLGLRFRDIAGMHTVGLIVLESTRIDRLNLNNTRNLFANTEGQRLAQMLDITRYRRIAMPYDSARES